MKRYLVLLFLSVIASFCNTSKTTITLSKCEQQEDGSFLCDVNGTPTPANQFCTYDVTSVRGADCSSLNIGLGTVICVACVANQNTCPQPAVFVVDGKDCIIKATKFGPPCLRCPRGGVPVKIK